MLSGLPCDNLVVLDLLLSGINMSEDDRGLKLNGLEKNEYVSVLSRDSR